MRPQRFHYPIVHGKNKIWGCLYLYSIDLLLDLSNIRRIGKPTTRIYMPPSTLDTHNTQTVCVCRIASFFRYNIRTSHRPSLFSLARIFPFWVSRACINKTSVFPMVQPQSSPSPAAGRPTIFDITVNQSNHHIQHKRKKKKVQNEQKGNLIHQRERGVKPYIFQSAGRQQQQPARLPSLMVGIYRPSYFYYSSLFFPFLFLLFERGSSSWPTKITNGHATFSYVQQTGTRRVCV